MKLFFLTRQIAGCSSSAAAAKVVELMCAQIRCVADMLQKCFFHVAADRRIYNYSVLEFAPKNQYCISVGLALGLRCRPLYPIIDRLTVQRPYYVLETI